MSKQTIGKSYYSNLSKNQVNKSLKLFFKLLTLAERDLKRQQYITASYYAQIAAYHAFTNHCGIFASPRLERVLSTIGHMCIKLQKRQMLNCRFRLPPKNILHVLTYAREIGGDTRFVWRWINGDENRRHFVAITRQGEKKVPNKLNNAVLSSGGKIHTLNIEHDILSRAQKLAEISTQVDLVILHLFPDDIVPSIAFAKNTLSPPVVYVNLSDHTFWVGLAASNIVVHLRNAGYILSTRRRHLLQEKPTFVPTPINCKKRNLSITQAKQRLGFTERTILILTIATPFKYETINGISFVDAVLHILESHPDVVLMAIGPKNTPQWEKGYLRTNGRVIAMGVVSDTQIYYEAADLYLDSFPFSSITSLLEAGSYGIPLLRFCAHPQEIEILCAGAPGIDSKLMHFTNLKDYQEKIKTLINDAEERKIIGKLTKENINKYHSGKGWKRHIEVLYGKEIILAKKKIEISGCEEISNNTLDNLLNVLLLRLSVGLGPFIDSYIGPLHYTKRLRMALNMLQIERGFSMSLFLPPFAERRLSGHFNSVRRLPLISQFLQRTSY